MRALIVLFLITYGTQSASHSRDFFDIFLDKDGFAELFSKEDAAELVTHIPSYRECSKLGKWLVEKVPMRDVNRFFVMKDRDIAVCKIINGEWGVTSTNGPKAHIV